MLKLSKIYGVANAPPLINMQREVIEDTPLWCLITIDHESTVVIYLHDSKPTDQDINSKMAALRLLYTRALNAYNELRLERPILPNITIPCPKVIVLPTEYLKATIPNYAPLLVNYPTALKTSINMQEVVSKILELEEQYQEQTALVNSALSQIEYQYKLRDGNSVQRVKVGPTEVESILYLKNALSINRNTPINQVHQFVVYPELCMLVDSQRYQEAKILASLIFGNVTIDNRVLIGYIPVDFAYGIFLSDSFIDENGKTVTSELLITQADLIYRA